MIPGFGAGLIIETRSLPNLLVATLATLPSMSLIPSAPFPICGNRKQCARAEKVARRRLFRRVDVAFITAENHSCSFMHHKRLTMRQNRTSISIRVRFRLAAPSTSLKTGFTKPERFRGAPQFSAVTSAFDDVTQQRYDKLWRISVLHLIVSFLFRITIRWINARGTWCLVAGQ